MTETKLLSITSCRGLKLEAKRLLTGQGEKHGFYEYAFLGGSWDALEAARTEIIEEWGLRASNAVSFCKIDWIKNPERPDDGKPYLLVTSFWTSAPMIPLKESDTVIDRSRLPCRPETKIPATMVVTPIGTKLDESFAIIQEKWGQYHESIRDEAERDGGFDRYAMEIDQATPLEIAKGFAEWLDEDLEPPERNKRMWRIPEFGLVNNENDIWNHCKRAELRDLMCKQDVLTMTFTMKDQTEKTVQVTRII